MNDFIAIKKPNLPENKVRHAVLSGKFPNFAESLKKLGITTFLTDKCHDVMPQISYHADIVFSHLGDNNFIVEKSQIKLKDNLLSIGFYSADEVELGKNYPEDVLLNTCLVDGKLICGKNLFNHPTFSSIKIISTAQGYSKCSVCVVDSNSVITDDESIYTACNKNEMDVLLISKGSVILPGFNYGFIGGCSGKISSDCIAFCGDLSTHSDFSKIKSFLKFRNIEFVNLGSRQLVDIGSIIPVTEES